MSPALARRAAQFGAPPALRCGARAGPGFGRPAGDGHSALPCRRLGWLAGWRLGAAVLAWLAAAMAGAQPVSPAEVLLFETDHLARVTPPATLVYEFRKQSNVEPAFTDTVQLNVSRNKGQVHAALRFLSGARTHALPDIDDVHGNPVLLGFLERDIAEMKRLTGGSAGYFRKRIRLALASAAQVTPQRIAYGGKTVEARAVRIQPYLDDPLHARFESYVRKTYTFILSDQVPGGVYRIGTTLSNTAGNGPAAGAMAARQGAGGKPAGLASAATAQPGSGPSGPVAATVLSSSLAKAGGPVPAPAGGAARAGAASADAAPTGGSANAAAPRAAAPAAGQPGTATPGATQPGATQSGASVPVIDETLTLVKVEQARR